MERPLQYDTDVLQSEGSVREKLSLESRKTVVKHGVGHQKKGTQVWIPETSMILQKLLSWTSPIWTSKSKSSGYFSIFIVPDYSAALSKLTSSSFLKYLLCSKCWGCPAHVPLILLHGYFLPSLTGDGCSDFIFYTHSWHCWLQTQLHFSLSLSKLQVWPPCGSGRNEPLPTTNG